jgi:NADP-dependent 3-hydroxy acid dehydrogenase YdfG
MNIENKTAIITGASSGIGAAFSKALIKKGAVVYGLARRMDKLKALQKELGDNFKPVKLDVTSHAEIESWVQKTFKDDHLPDILINNAGLATFGDVDKLPVTDWQTMQNTNVNGVFYLTRNVVPFMKLNPEICHIINISSIAGLLGNPKMSGYNASKYAVRGLVKLYSRNCDMTALR